MEGDPHQSSVDRPPLDSEPPQSASLELCVEAPVSESREEIEPTVAAPDNELDGNGQPGGDEGAEKLVKELEIEDLEKGDRAPSAYSPEDLSSETRQNRSTVPEVFPPGQFHPSSSPFNHPPGSLHLPHPYYQNPAYNHPYPSFYNQQPGWHQGGYQQGWPGYTGAPAFPAPQPRNCATPPGSMWLMQPSSNSGLAFSPPTGKNEDESGPRSIKVRGFDLKMNDLPDVLESYFGSKRKSGGGVVDDVEIKKKVAIITFESAAIARRVLSKTDHTFKGKPVTVELYDPGVKKQNPAIKVTGLPPDMDDEVVETHFESKRKSEGGEVARMERRKGGRVAIITFKEMEVATQVASKSNHQIKGKSVTVELFDSDDDMPEQDPVIKVTGLPPNMEDDQVETYFESKRKSGGGEVVKMERRKGGRIAIVTFKEMEVAQRVVSRKYHSIEDHPITVELYDPDDDTPVQDPVIKVTGLPPNMEDDKVEAFFGSKRKCGGGDIVKMERRKGGSIAIVTFKEMEDAKRVVEKGQHSIQNTKVDVCFWDEDDDEGGGESSGADIEVRGFKPSTTDEVIQVYFENKSKSGGGAVKSLKRNKKKGVITITFDSPKVVERVVSKRDHTLEGKKLTITAKKTSHSDSASGDDSGDEDFQSAEEGDEAETSTVKVTGILEGTSEDTFTLYFENERKSGGGDLKSCSFSLKEQALLVTFQSPKVAQRVAEKTDHHVAGQELTVRLHIPPSKYKDRVLFEGVPESVSHDALLLYLENVTNQDGLKVLYGDEPGTILVTFPCNVDFEAIQDKCQKRSLDGQHMTPQQVEITSCILVKSVTPEITKTILELYFDNKNRSGGEGVEEVEMMPDVEMAIIKFEDHKVAEQVAKRRQEVSRKVLEVSLHHECLGMSGGTEDPTYFKFPEPLEMKELDPFKTGYLQRLEKATANLQTTLSALEACLDPQALQRGCLVVECSVSKDAKDGRRRTRNWSQKARKAVEDFMETFAVIELNVSHEIQEDLTVGMTAMVQEYPCCTLVEHNTKLAVVGPHAEMASIRESISAVTKEVQESHDRKKNLTEETMSVQTASKMDLLCMVGLPASVQEKHPKLEVAFRRDSQQVLLKGIDAEILAAKLAIMELLEAMTPLAMSEFSIYQMELMGEKEASAVVNACLREAGLRASWEVKEGQLLVLTLTPAERDPVQNLLKKIVLEANIELDDEQRVLVKWHDWKKEIQNFKGMWVIGYDGEKGILIVAAIHEVFPEVKQQVEHFLEENAEYTTTFHARGPKLKFLNLHNRDNVEQMKRTFQVEIWFQEKDSVQIKGKKGRISQAWQDVSNALSSIQVQTRRLNQFQIKKCLTKTQRGQQRVEDLQKSIKCVIDMEASDGDVQEEMQREVEEEDRDSMAMCTVPGTGVNIQLMGTTASQTSAEATLVVLGKEEEQELKAQGVLGMGTKPKQVPKTPVPKPPNPLRQTERASRADSSLVVAVYAEDKGTIERVFGILMSIAKGQMDHCTVMERSLCEWEEAEIKKLTDLSELGVDVTVQLHPGQVELWGLNEVIIAAQSKVHEVISKRNAAKQERGKAENMANFTQWNFVETEPEENTETSRDGKDEDEPGPRSIKVRGFDSKMNDLSDVLESYFGSKRKSGGGTVDDVEIKKKVAIITFETAAIARRVLSKTGHTIRGKPVTVELYDPGVKKQNPAIKVTGLPPDMDDEMVETYFESKRKSEGGEVVRMERRKEGRVSIITFKEMEVATRVASKSNHQIKGKPVTVELFDWDDDMPEQDPVIKVTGLPPNMEDEKVEEYFESKRKSGGGEVVKMERRKGGRIAIVTFKEMEGKDEDESGPRSIKVRGFDSKMNDLPGVLESYFGSERKSGGGAVDDVEIKKKVAISASLELCVHSPESESREEMEPTVAAPDNEQDGNGQYEGHLQPTALNEIGDKEGKEDEDEKGEEEEANEEIPEEERQMHDEGQDGETFQKENKQNEIDDGDEGAEELVKELEKEEEELEKGDCAPSTYLPEDHSSEVQQYRSPVPEGDEGDERATDDSSLNSRPQHISDESSCQQYQLQNQEQNQELLDRMLPPPELRGSPYMHGIFPQGHPGHFPPGQFQPSNSPFYHPPGSLHLPQPYYQNPAYNHPYPSFYNQQPGLHQGGYQQGWPGYTGAPAFLAPQPTSRATPPGCVRLIRPSSNSGSAFSSPTGKDEDESGPRSIKVRGFDSTMNDLPDVLKSYFGSERKSGGGVVDDVEIKKNVAIITFESAAKRRKMSRLRSLPFDPSSLRSALTGGPGKS